MTGKVIAAVNRKGGVGKTTFVIALADTLVSEFKSSVIVVDADPQASASIALIGPENTLERSTLRLSLKSAIEALSAGKANLKDFVVGQVNRISGRADVPLALVSNGEELWDFEADLAQAGRLHVVREAMALLLRELKAHYKYVLVDCPPGQTHTSGVALSAADLILSPTVPDRLSNWGLDGLERYITANMEEGQKAYFVATRYRAVLNEHRDFFDQLVRRDGTRIGLLRRDSELESAGAIGSFIDEDKRFVERMGVKTPQTFARIYGSKASVQLIEIAKAIRRELGS